LIVQDTLSLSSNLLQDNSHHAFNVIAAIDTRPPASPTGITVARAHSFPHPLQGSLSVPEQIVLSALRTGSPVIIADTTANSAFRDDLNRIQHQPTSILCVPIFDTTQLAEQVGNDLSYAIDMRTTNAAVGAIATAKPETPIGALYIENCPPSELMQPKIYEMVHYLCHSVISRSWETIRGVETLLTRLSSLMEKLTDLCTFSNIPSYLVLVVDRGRPQYKVASMKGLVIPI